MREVLYGLSSAGIAMSLLVIILLTVEAGFRAGRRQHGGVEDSVKDQTKAVDASILGLLSLLLGFTFTMALQHFDARHHAMVKEANAIGTAHVRAALLPAPHDQNAAQLLRNYVDQRVLAGEVDLAQSHPFAQLAEKTSGLQRELWSEATAAARKDPGPVTTGLFAQAVNDLMDAQVERDAALERHVPEYILVLLMVVAIAGSLITGYSSGLAGRQRPTWAFGGLSIVIALVVFMIADLDRPRRGLIHVGQVELLQLKAGMEHGPTQ